MATRTSDKWHTLIDCFVVIASTLFVISSLEPRHLLSLTTTTGGDAASHYYTIDYLTKQLIPNFKFIGWCPGNYAGFPLFQFYFPMPFLAMAFLDLFLPVQIAFKIVSVLGVILLPFISYTCMRLLRYRYPIPAIAALFTLPFLYADGHTMWGGNILSTLAGEFHYQLGFALCVLFSCSMYRNIESGKHVKLNGILLGITGLTHGVGLVFAGTSCFYFLLSGRKLTEKALYIARVYILAIAIMAFWFFPFLAGSNWSTKSNHLWHINSITEVFPKLLWPYLLIACIGLIYWCRFQIKNMKGSSSTRKNPFSYIVYLIILSVVLYETAYELNVINIRFLPFLNYLPMLVAAICLGTVLQNRRGVFILLLVLTLSTFIWIHHTTQQVPSWSSWNYSGFEGKPKWKEYQAINEYLKGNQSDPRVVFEHSPAYDRYGSIRAFENLPLFSGRSTIEGLYMQSSITAPYAFYLQSEISKYASVPLPQFDYTYLNLSNALHHFHLMNIGHYIVISAEAKEAASQQTNLHRAATFGDIEIYEVTDNSSGYVTPLPQHPVIDSRKNWRMKSHHWFRHPSHNKPSLLFTDKTRNHDNCLNSLPTVLSNDYINLPTIPFSNDLPEVTSHLNPDSIDITTTSTGHPLLVKVSYHPNWTCKGAKGPYLASPSFMIIYPTDKTITMQFRRGLAQHAGALTTLFALILCLLPRRHTAWLFSRKWEIAKWDHAEKLMNILVKSTWTVAALAIISFVVFNHIHNPERIKMRATNAFHKNRNDKARKLFEELLTKHPTSCYIDESNFFVGLTYWRTSKPEKAKVFFNNVIQQFPESLYADESLYHLALCEYALNNKVAAIQIWSDVTKRFPKTEWATYSKQKIKEARKAD